MKCAPRGEGWLLQWNALEAGLMSRSLAALREQYRLRPEDVPAPLRSHFQGRLSRDPNAASSLREASADLSEERAAWRSARAEVLDRWLEEYAAIKPGKSWNLEVTAEETGELLSMVNDRRLALAAEFSIGQAEMDMDPQAVEPESLKEALWEVHVLAFFQENILAAIQGREPGAGNPAQA